MIESIAYKTLDECIEYLDIHKKIIVGGFKDSGVPIIAELLKYYLSCKDSCYTTGNLRNYYLFKNGKLISMIQGDIFPNIIKNDDVKEPVVINPSNYLSENIEVFKKSNCSQVVLTNEVEPKDGIVYNGHKIWLTTLDKSSRIDIDFTEEVSKLFINNNDNIISKYMRQRKIKNIVQ